MIGPIDHFSNLSEILLDRPPPQFSIHNSKFFIPTSIAVHRSHHRSFQNTVTLISPSHGTGKLKEGVHAYLKRHDRIAKFEPAEKYDGGAGVTVAYPK